MLIRFPIDKDGKRIVSKVFEIKTGEDFKSAGAEIWRKARQATPLLQAEPGEFLSGMDGLWGVGMVFEKP